MAQVKVQGKDKLVAAPNRISSGAAKAVFVVAGSGGLVWIGIRKARRPRTNLFASLSPMARFHEICAWPGRRSASFNTNSKSSSRHARARAATCIVSIGKAQSRSCCDHAMSKGSSATSPSGGKSAWVKTETAGRIRATSVLPSATANEATTPACWKSAITRQSTPMKPSRNLVLETGALQ